jgi:hypothetical protein
MAWDFSTDPEFEAQLAWAREFVREEVWPLETVGNSQVLALAGTCEQKERWSPATRRSRTS